MGYKLISTEDEKTFLTKLVTKRKAPARQVVRGQVLIAVALNGLKKTDSEVAVLYSMSIQTKVSLR